MDARAKYTSKALSWSQTILLLWTVVTVPRLPFAGPGRSSLPQLSVRIGASVTAFPSPGGASLVGVLCLWTSSPVLCVWQHSWMVPLGGMGIRGDR